MMFHVFLNYPKQRFIVSDLNSDLVLSYITIRDRVDELISSLKNHAKNYSKNSNSYYYSIRDSEPKGQVEKIKEKLVDVLSKERTGLSGVEISKKLGLNSDQKL